MYEDKETGNEGVMKSFKDPGITVKEHLDRIKKKDIDAPMFNNTFPLLAYIPKTENAKEYAGKLIEGAKLQSSWISNFKMSSARTLYQKISPTGSKQYSYTERGRQEIIQNTVQK